MCVVCCKNVLKTNRLFWDPTPVFLRLADFSSKVITSDLGLRVQTEYFSRHISLRFIVVEAHCCAAGEITKERC